MESFFYPSYYPRPSRYYGSEPPFYSRDWMVDMDPRYGGRMHPFRHSPFGYRRPVLSPAATRRGCDGGRLRGDVFTPRRSRVTSVRLPFQQLFNDELFRSALTDDVIGLLEHHLQKLDEANKKTEDTGANAAAKDTTPSSALSASSENASPDAATPTTGGGDTAKPASTSSTESSKDSSSSDDNAKKEVAEEKEQQPCDGYILHYERSPFGLVRPVYSPVTLRREQQADAAPFKQLLDDEFFKSSLTDDLVSLLEHHVTRLDDANGTKSGNESTENDTSSGGAVAREEDVDKTVKPFNVALKLGDFQPENVNVSLDGRKVIVKAKREEQGDDDSWKRHSHVEYSFMLPEDAPAESLTSSFNTDGVLSITAKTDDAVSKPLEVPAQKEG